MCDRPTRRTHGIRALACAGVLALCATIALAHRARADSCAEQYQLSAATVVDHDTNLVWQRSLSATMGSWQEAVSECEALSLDGYDDWRLPTVDELLTTVDERALGWAIDESIFPGMSDLEESHAFWTSTGFAADSTLSFLVNYEDGSAFLVPRELRLHVRCVRNATDR